MSVWFVMILFTHATEPAQQHFWFRSRAACEQDAHFITKRLDSVPNYRGSLVWCARKGFPA